MDAQYDSVALRQMLNMIYSKHIYANSRLLLLPGPICRLEEAPDPAKHYNATSPGKLPAFWSVFSP